MKPRGEYVRMPVGSGGDRGRTRVKLLLELLGNLGGGLLGGGAGRLLVRPLVECDKEEQVGGYRRQKSGKKEGRKKGRTTH